MAKMEKIGKMQVVDNKGDKFFYFPMISMPCTGSGYKKKSQIFVNQIFGSFLLYGVFPKCWLTRLLWLTRFLVGLRIKFHQSKEKKLDINDSPKLCPELFDFCIERFSKCIG